MFTLQSSGSNAHGQLANGSLEDFHEFRSCSFFGCQANTMPPNTERVLNIASGANHTIVLLETRSSNGTPETEMWGCGDGSAGQLGPAYRQLIQSGASSTVFRPLSLPFQQMGLVRYQIKLVSASWETTYVAMTCDGKGDILISMGADDFGDLGIGGKSKEGETTACFHTVSFVHLTVDGAPLSNANITVQSVASGQHHVVVQLQATWSDHGTKTCTLGWGTSRHGQLGNVLDRGGRPVPYLSTPQIIPTGDPSDPILSTALGNQHTVFLHASGKVSSLGSNRKGQLQGLGTAQQVTQLSCTWNGTYVVADDDEGSCRIHSTGSGTHGQLGRQSSPQSLAPVELMIPLNSFNVSAMACGTEHVLALLSGPATATSSEVWGWGWNEHGNLGTGATDDVFIPVKVWPPGSTERQGHSRTAIEIWAGSGTSWILTR